MIMNEGEGVEWEFDNTKGSSQYDWSKKSYHLCSYYHQHRRSRRQIDSSKDIQH